MFSEIHKNSCVLFTMWSPSNSVWVKTNDTLNNPWYSISEFHQKKFMNMHQHQGMVWLLLINTQIYLDEIEKEQKIWNCCFIYSVSLFVWMASFLTNQILKVAKWSPQTCKLICSSLIVPVAKGTTKILERYLLVCHKH